MRPRFTVWLAALALVAAILVPATALAGPKPAKTWSLYVDKLGAYSVSTAVPKGQSLVAGPFGTQAAAWATLSTPPTIEYLLTPSAPDGAHGWFTGNVTLDWTITDAPKVLPEYLKVTGGQDVTITQDQQAKTYSAYAESVGGTFGPVEVTIARDATDPVLNIGAGIANGQSFEVGSVPAEPTFSASDAMSGIDTSSFTGYGATVGTHTLVATATDMAGHVAQSTIAYTVTPHPAAVLAPTAQDETFSGTPGVALPGSISIPTVAGVDYAIDGVPVAPGAHDYFAGSYHVTAAAQAPDYVMTGYPADGWMLTIAAAPVFVEVTPAAPIAVDQQFVSPGVASQGGIDITATTGVDYFIDGAAATGFVPLDPGSYLVTAQPWAYYTLVGQHAWQLAVVGIDPTVHVTPAAPQAFNETAPGNGFVRIPLSTGVDYKLDGVAKAAGDYVVVAGPHAVVATPQFGYLLDGTTSWNLTVKAFVAPATLDLTGINYPSGSPNAARDPITVMREPFQSVDPWVQTGPPMVVDEANDTITFTVPVNGPNTPLGGNAFTGYFPNIAAAQYQTVVTPAGADVGYFATVELSPSLVGQESKFTLSFISTVYGRPVTKVQIGTVPQTLPINNLNLEATNWGAATGGHDYLIPGVGVQWANVTGTGSFTVTMHFTATAL
jgi:hypothetical protein